MTIEPGTRLGPYEIVSPIGAGGMGEVWRARDTRLDRDVAIKVLPPGLAESELFLQRFEREAKTISQLNHSHVCTLYDVGATSADDSTTVHYLVMELLEGESLADRVKKGPLPLPDVLKFGRQIASALDAAHRQGITHRDLKPGNVMLTKSGAKLLDFGLAKTATESTAPIDGLTNMPTAARPLTTEGTILGTFQYMAPEQLEGLEADARTDIFALGAVLYEMATGRRAFQGQTKTSLIAAIVSSQPEPISSVAPMAPPALDHVVRKCLEKDADDRWQSAHDVASELEWISEAGSQAGVASAITIRRRTREWLAWLAAVVVVATIAVLVTKKLQPAPPPPPPPMMFSIQAPKGTWLTGINPSPDGRKLLLRVIDERGEPRLWVRSVVTGTLKELDGTTDANSPFWSPDGQWIGFFARSKLLKVPADGRSRPIEIAETPVWSVATWGQDGTILFAPSWDTPIYGVSDKGGIPEPVTTLEPGEASHVFGYRRGDGRIMVGVAMKQAGGRKDEEGIYVETPGETARKLVLRINPFTLSLSSRGLLTYTDDPPKITLRRFDQKTLELKDPEEYGLPLQVQTADNSDDLRVFAQIDRGPESLRTATWYDRSGKVIGTIGEPGYIESPAISPDETRVALEYTRDGVQEIRNYEVRRGIATSVHKSEVKWRQIWTPDGRSIVFALQTESGKSDIVRASADGTGDATTLVKGEHYATPNSISRDGRWLVFASDSANDPTYDLWIEDLDNPGKPRRLINSPNGIGEGDGAFSPDASWVAYRANEGAREEVYVVNVQSGKRIRVSRDGGFQPRWRGDQRELFYLTRADEIMAVSVESKGDELIIGEPRALFKAPILGWNRLYDATGDGQRFLVLTGEQYRPTSATILLNWFERPAAD
jgi:serine/threonine protein kinase